MLVALERTGSEKKGGGWGFNSIIVNKKTVFTALTVTKFIVIIMMNLFFYRKSIPNVRSKGSLFHYQTGLFAKTCTYVSLPRSFMWKQRFLYIKVFIVQENSMLTNSPCKNNRNSISYNVISRKFMPTQEKGKPVS